MTLIGEGAIYHAPKTKEEASLIRRNYGWSGEDYRQAVINPNLEDAIPKEEDFLPFPFRHISATIVGAGSWKATDFSKPGVLKKAVPMVANKPVYVNHEWETGNVVGVNGQGKWQAEFKASDGQIIPAGIDAAIFIDAKLHTDICRKLQAYPVPHIQSVSISVLFEWEPSHVFENSSGQEDEWMFENRIGTSVDGEMVTRVVTKILDVYETSLVWLGADPFAKILNEKGEPLNVEKAGVVGLTKFDKDPLADYYKSNNRYFVYESCFAKEENVNLYKQKELNFVKSEKENTMDLKIILAGMLNVKPEEVTEELLKNHSLVKTVDLSAMKTKADSLSGVQADLVTEKGNVDKYKGLVPLDKLTELNTSIQEFGKDSTIETLIPLAKYGQETLNSSRKLCEKHYKISVGEKNEDQAVLDLINKASEKEIAGLLKQYGATNIDAFAGSCVDCGSENISFRSTKPEDSGEGESDATFDMPGAFRK